MPSFGIVYWPVLELYPPSTSIIGLLKIILEPIEGCNDWVVVALKQGWLRFVKLPEMVRFPPIVPPPMVVMVLGVKSVNVVFHLVLFLIQ